MMPLYKKLEKKLYEENQYLDKESLFWIEKNLIIKKNLNVILNISPLDLKTFLEFIPKREWFRRKNVNNIHGLMHILRVMIFSYILCKKFRIKNYKMLLLVASLHDIRRKNDKTDPNHGKNAANWFDKHGSLCNKVIGKKKFLEVIKILKDHDSENIKKDKFSKILICADALDRYRLPKKKWWLREEYLPLEIEEEIINFAKIFILETEKQRILENKDPLETMINIGKKYKILRGKI